MSVALWAVVLGMLVALALVLTGGRHRHPGVAYGLMWGGLLLGCLVLWVAVLLGILSAAEAR